MKQLPEKWNFDGRPAASFADTDGMAMEVRQISNYFRAELYVKAETGVKYSWTAGVWCHRPTEAEAIAEVEALAVAAGLVKPR